MPFLCNFHSVNSLIFAAGEHYPLSSGFTRSCRLFPRFYFIFYFDLGHTRSVSFCKFIVYGLFNRFAEKSFEWNNYWEDLLVDIVDPFVNFENFNDYNLILHNII